MSREWQFIKQDRMVCVVCTRDGVRTSDGGRDYVTKGCFHWSPMGFCFWLYVATMSRHNRTHGTLFTAVAQEPCPTWQLKSKPLLVREWVVHTPIRPREGRMHFFLRFKLLYSCCGGGTSTIAKERQHWSADVLATHALCQ